MTNDMALAEVVRAWAADVLPGEPAVADSAAAAAAAAYRQGATVTVACQVARAFLSSWARHPAHPAATEPLRLVS